MAAAAATINRDMLPIVYGLGVCRSFIRNDDPRIAEFKTAQNRDTLMAIYKAYKGEEKIKFKTSYLKKIKCDDDLYDYVIQTLYIKLIISLYGDRYLFIVFRQSHLRRASKNVAESVRVRHCMSFYFDRRHR